MPPGSHNTTDETEEGERKKKEKKRKRKRKRERRKKVIYLRITFIACKNEGERRKPNVIF